MVIFLYLYVYHMYIPLELYFLILHNIILIRILIQDFNLLKNVELLFHYNVNLKNNNYYYKNFLKFKFNINILLGLGGVLNSSF